MYELCEHINGRTCPIRSNEGDVGYCGQGSIPLIAGLKECPIKAKARNRKGGHKGTYKGKNINTHSRRFLDLKRKNIPGVVAAISANREAWYRPGGELNRAGKDIFK